jgi:hypothetical protein
MVTSHNNSSLEPTTDGQEPSRFTATKMFKLDSGKDQMVKEVTTSSISQEMARMVVNS